MCIHICIYINLLFFVLFYTYIYKFKNFFYFIMYQIYINYFFYILYILYIYIYIFIVLFIFSAPVSEQIVFVSATEPAVFGSAEPKRNVGTSGALCKGSSPRGGGGRRDLRNHEHLARLRKEAGETADYNCLKDKI